MSEIHVQRLQRLMALLSEDGRAESYLREFWERRSQYPDRDRHPTPNTFEEAERRIAYFLRYWQTKLPPEPLGEIEMMKWVGQARATINRMPVFTRMTGTVSEDRGWLAAVREARIPRRGGLQFIYNEMVNSHIWEFDEIYADALIRRLIPPEASLEDVQAYWNANKAALEKLGPPLSPSAELEFVTHFRTVLKVLSRQLGPVYQALDPHAGSPGTR